MDNGAPNALLEAYRCTTYRLAAPDGCIDIRIGRRHLKVDVLLSALSVTEWAFVTAWNPGSTLVPTAQNAAAQVELERIVRERGHAFYRGEGIPDQPGWAPERSLWIAGIARAAAFELGRRFGQKAIVVGSSGASAELLFCDAT